MVRQSRHYFQQLSRTLALLVVLAQLALVSASIWHHHDEGGADHADHSGHGDCAVCVAIASPTIHNDPGARIALPPQKYAGVLPCVGDADVSIARVWILHARGPPEM